jgi:hypothetical protein
LTVNVWPPIVSVPDLAGPELASTSYLTMPFPFPLPLPSILSHVALLVEVQLHPAAAVTFTVLLLTSPAGAFTLVGEIEIEQPLA